jgi:hypothetical protein
MDEDQTMKTEVVEDLQAHLEGNEEMSRWKTHDSLARREVVQGVAPEIDGVKVGEIVLLMGNIDVLLHLLLSLRRGDVMGICILSVVRLDMLILGDEVAGEGMGEVCLLI